MRKPPVLCMDLGGTNVRLGLVSASGQVLHRRRAKMTDPQAREDIYHTIAQMVTSFLASHKHLPSPGGVAIGFAGPTKSSEGYVYFSPNIGQLSNLRVSFHLQKLIGMPVFVENDANCAALGEYWRGAGRGAESLFLFTIGTGVGGGFVVGGELWDGHDGIAGEVGHMVVEMTGPRCSCGNRGCLETLVSARAIVGKYNRMRKVKSRGRRQQISAKAVVDRAKRGESIAKTVISEAAQALGVGIANVFNLINPELILVGGGVSRAGRILIDPAVRRAREMIFASLRDSLTVRRSKLGDDAGLIGAAYLAYKRLVI